MAKRKKNWSPDGPRPSHTYRAERRNEAREMTKRNPMNIRFWGDRNLIKMKSGQLVRAH